MFGAWPLAGRTVMDEKVINKLKASLADGKLPCAVAFRIAGELGLEPKEIGHLADELDIKISRCQLGLFGHERRRAEPAQDVAEELAERLKASLGGGRLPCAKAWEIARELGIKHMRVGRAADTLGIRISQCQLGCF